MFRHVPLMESAPEVDHFSNECQSSVRVNSLLSLVWRPSTLLVALVVTVVGARSANAYDQRNQWGNYLNGLARQGEYQARQGAVQYAVQAWNSVNPEIYQCLMQSLSPQPPVLAQNGIPPSDPRLQPYFQRCAAGIGQAQAQRNAAAQQAAEAQQRQQAEEQSRKAQQDQYEAELRARQQAEEQRKKAEQQQLQAQERARQQAAERAKEIEQQQRLAEEKRIKALNEATFAEVQKMPELAGYFGMAQPTLVFLHVGDSPRLTKGMDGNFTTVGGERPVICRVGEGLDESNPGLLSYALAKLSSQTKVPIFDLIACGDLSSPTIRADVISFSSRDVNSNNSISLKTIGYALKSGLFQTILTSDHKEYDEKIAADERLVQDIAAKKRETAAAIGVGIDDGSLGGVALLQFGSSGGLGQFSSGGQSICLEGILDPELIATAISNATDPDVLKLTDGLRTARRLSLEDAFIQIKFGKCQIFGGEAASIRKLRVALKRDNLSAGDALTAIAPLELERAKSELARQRQTEREEKIRRDTESTRLAVAKNERERAAAAEAAKIIEAQERERKEQERWRNEAAQLVLAEKAKEYPYVAILTCELGGNRGVAIEVCFSAGHGKNTEIKLKNGEDVGIYNAWDFYRVGKGRKDGFYIELREHFSIRAQNGADSVVLRMKILNQATHAIVYENVASQWEVLSVKN